MKIAGTYLKPKGHLNGSQIDYIKSRLNSIIQEINVEIYQISVQNVEITESQEIWIDIYRGMHPAAIIKIVNGSHEVKKKEYNQVDGVLNVVYDLGMYNDFVTLKRDIKNWVQINLLFS